MERVNYLERNGWAGANNASIGERCDKCGKASTRPGEVRIYHAVSHILVCEECAKGLHPDKWHGCGCGG